MTASKLILSLMLLPLAALPSEAQQIAPVALRVTDASIMEAMPEPVRPLVARRDTEPDSRPTFSQLGGVVGGVLGGVVGTVAGAYVGGLSAAGCHGEFCGLGRVILGAGIGESIGLGLGAHIGSRSQRHENIMLTSLTSTAILVGGTALGLAMSDGGAIMLPLTPALQLAAALAIERY